MKKDIIKNNKEIFCNLQLHEEGLYPKFTLFTANNGYGNKYIISAKVSGLFSCKESGLYFTSSSVEHISETNEQTLQDHEVLEIFDQLTREDN